MKKLLLSMFIVGLFIINGLSKQEDANSTPLTTQQVPGQNTSNTPTNAPQAAAGTPPPQPTIQKSSINPPAQQGQYKDGTYTGSPADAFYGNIQVQAVISGGRITDVQFLQYPNDRSTSIAINSQAMPYLKQEAIQVQNANVDIISGATDSSQAFQESLASALSQAH